MATMTLACKIAQTKTGPGTHQVSIFLSSIYLQLSLLRSRTLHLILAHVLTCFFHTIAGGEDILTRQNNGDDFDDLNNTLKKDFQNRMNQAEQASKAAAARSQVPKVALDSTRKNQAMDEGCKRPQREIMFKTIPRKTSLRRQKQVQMS